MKNLQIIFLIALMFFSSCIEKIQLDTVDSPRLLVVEGKISNEPGPYLIHLSYSSVYNTDPNYFKANERITGAKVSIHDYNTFAVEELTMQEKGIYATSENFKAILDHEYFLEIIIDDKVYESTVNKVNTAPQMDSIYYERIGTTSDIGVYVDFQDNISTNNYYQWTWDGFYQLLVSPPASPDTFDCCLVCYVPAKGKNINILDDKLINGESINKYLVTTIPIIDPVGPTEHLVTVKQGIISEEYYDYLELLDKQFNDEGGLFDPLPFRLIGNIKNINNDDEVVLGYFNVAGERSRYIKIDRGQYSGMPPFYRNNLGDCRDAVPNDNATLIPPENWN